MKGKQFENYPPPVAKGILLHREIDVYTDTHAIVSLSKDKLREKYRHYSGVIVDMYYDHFLAKNFDQYSEIPLEEFAQNSYKIMQEHWYIIPAKAQNMLHYMIKGNWLANYAKPEGLHRSLQGLSRRTKFDSKLDLAIQDLYEQHDAFESEFHDFFKEIVKHISQFREDLINSPK